MASGWSPLGGHLAGVWGWFRTDLELPKAGE